MVTLGSAFDPPQVDRQAQILEASRLLAEATRLLAIALESEEKPDAES